MQYSNDDVWSIVKSNLISKNTGNRLLQTWFLPTDLVSIENNASSKRFRLGVPTELHKYWISENLFERICSEISSVCKQPFEVELVVTGKSMNADPESPGALHQVMSSSDRHEEIPPMTVTMTPVPTKKPGDFLNGEYSFSSFVVGRNNEFAHATSFRIAQRPGSEGYNPLFICGPTGMGKTHLLHAVGNYIRDNNPESRILYISAERFLNECISSIRRGEMDKFKQRFRENCDLLLMDDIQVLGRGEAVQEEFFHTLNHFFEKGRQVVVASDRIPKDIKGLEDRIRTRLEWGLIADIQMPDIETRMAILRYKAERRSIALPDDVINYIAKISKRSIRELEGNLNKVKMFSELQGLPINLDLTKKVLAVHDDSTTITIDEIQRLVAEHYKIRVVDLKSKSRNKPIVTARQMAMHFIKHQLDKSLVDIGRAFGSRDHTTVLNALRRIDSQLLEDSDLKKDFDELQGRIHNITGV
ncbi:MAG: chromosomal replication initiator protein DnaA [Bdellovibrionaceae bacterium]|nr:chromosomal replication initiator protein DnaA [Pseudobdellovibrionaceae bacterium]